MRLFKGEGDMREEGVLDRGVGERSMFGWEVGRSIGGLHHLLNVEVRRKEWVRGMGRWVDR